MKLGLPDLRALIVEALAGDRASGNYGNAYTADWKAACELVDLDMKPFEAEAKKARKYR